MQDQRSKQIEKIFGAEVEEPQDRFFEKAICKIESYGAKYDPNSDLSAFDQLQICEAIVESAPVEEKPFHGDVVKVKGNKVKVSYLDGSKTVTYVKKPTIENLSREDRSYYLAEELGDLDSLAYYEKLVSERRADFLRNCLIITLNAYRKGIIFSSKAKYFTGVIKRKTSTIQRIRNWEKRNKR